MAISCAGRGLHLWSPEGALTIAGGATLRLRDCFVRTYKDAAAAQGVVLGPAAADTIFGATDNSVVDVARSLVLYPCSVRAPPCGQDAPAAAHALRTGTPPHKAWP